MGRDQVEMFLKEARSRFISSYEFKQLMLKPATKHYEDESYLLVYALTVTHKVATYALTRYRLLHLWCMRLRLWAFPSDQRTVNWDRSHTLHNTNVSIGNLVGPATFMEHNVLGSATTILEHSTQSLDIFMDRQTAGMIRLSLRYNQVRRLLVSVIDSTHADLFLQLKSVALMSHIDARQLGSQQRAARIGRLELQLEDIGMMQRLSDLRTVCGPTAPSSTHFGVCLTMRIHVQCSTEVCIV
ncbi:RNA-dependent RNA polymerase 2-like [Tropilaelaps mercedesae]|uniref:RNA-dependent RNA polymerase 2-like n=1 Tax=Tropilaelaps mercedesae TaxID=418985 RepID=A0A1V9XJF7_9ACAR|nr:RNA-dependent RNA polymerase 2-like [Tropilaelaps mercedesae]